jgi:peptidoglycan hydrolase-like protein with peptidoglycan-binding domain
VSKLQIFLNKWMSTNLPVTGVYNPATLAAVNAFQAKYSDEILSPWGIDTPTGLVYLSTLRKINLLECPDLSLPLPALIDWGRNPNAQ